MTKKRGIAAIGQIDLTDIVKPKVRNSLFSVMPESGSVGVLPGVKPTIIFNEPMLESTLNGENIILMDERGRIPSRIIATENSVTIVPEDSLKSATNYFIRFGTGLRNKTTKKKVSALDNSTVFKTL